MNYAGFWLRAAAYVIDYVLAIVCLILVFLVFSVEDETGGLASLLSICTMWIYFTLFESSKWQATPGKRLLKIRVTDLSGSRITIGRAAARNLARILSGLLLGIGYIMAAFTDKKQALHDQMANTLVLKGVSNNDFAFDQINEENATDSISVVTAESSNRKRQKWVMAGFDSDGRVIRISFDFDDPRLLRPGIIIGRDSKSADIHIGDASISRSHARLFRIDQEVWIEDLSSTNGISISGKSLSPQGKSLLPSRGTLTIGRIILTIGMD